MIDLPVISSYASNENMPEINVGPVVSKSSSSASKSSTCPISSITIEVPVFKVKDGDGNWYDGAYEAGANVTMIKK